MKIDNYKNLHIFFETLEKVRFLVFLDEQSFIDSTIILCNKEFQLQNYDEVFKYRTHVLQLEGKTFY